MIDAEFIRNRITQLRISKNLSEYQLSFDLGHSRGYINNISSGKTLPSMSEFLYICEYFGITPSEFFNDKTTDPVLSHEIDSLFEELDIESRLLLISLARKLNSSNH